MYILQCYAKQQINVLKIQVAAHHNFPEMAQVMAGAQPRLLSGIIRV